MPGRPAKKGQKYRATIEIKGPQDLARFRAFKKTLTQALKKVNGKLLNPKKSGKAEADT